MGLTSVAYMILINGADVTEKWKSERRLLSIEAEDKEGETSDAVSLELDDRAPHIAWPPEGASLRLFLGNSADDITDLGTYTLDAPEASSPPSRLTVKGHAANFISSGPGLPMQTERTRQWELSTLGVMTATIAKDHGLVSRIQTALASEVVGNLEQIDESDLQFLSRVAKGFGARVRVKGGLVSGNLEVVGAGSVLPSVVLTPRDVERWAAPLGTRLKPGTVVATWHNPRTGLSGVKTAGNGEPRLVLAEVFDTSAAALSAVKSRLKDGDRKSAQINIALTKLNTGLSAGAEIAMSGFRSEIDTVWNVVEVRHRVTANMARTSLTAERAV